MTTIRTIQRGCVVHSAGSSPVLYEWEAWVDDEESPGPHARGPTETAALSGLFAKIAELGRMTCDAYQAAAAKRAAA